MNEMTCEEVRQLGAEVAVGVADARDRTAVFAHLERCARCRQELRQLSDVADTLAALAPAVEPPAGFESRLLAHLEGNARAATRQVSRRRPLWAVAAAVVAVVVGAIGWAIGDQSRPAPAVAAGHVVTAQLASAHRAVGQVVIDTGPEPWISMAVAVGEGDAPVQCRLRTSDGRVVSAGWFSLSKGYGYWAAPITAPGETLEAAQVSDADGRVLASAPLPSVRLAVSASQ
jgi:hypothetical protein